MLTDWWKIAVLSSWWILLCAGWAVSQEYFAKGLLNGRDDYEFASALARHGYEKLANYMVDMLTSEARDEQTRRMASLLRCRLLKIKAQRTSDSQQQKELYDQSIACYQGVIASLPSGIVRYKTMLDLGVMLLAVGQFYQEKAKQAESPAIADEARAASKRVFQQALGLYQKLKQLTDSYGAIPAKSPEAQIRYQAWYYICETLFMLSQNDGATAADNSAALKQVLRECENFIWEYEGYEAAYHAMLIMGQAYQALKKYQQAADCFDAVQALPYAPLFSARSSLFKSLAYGKLNTQVRKLFAQHNNRLSKDIVVEEVTPHRKWLVKDQAYQAVYSIIQHGDKCHVAKDTGKLLRIKAAYFKAQSLAQLYKYALIIKLIEKIRRRYTDYLKLYYGQALALELARAYMANGQGSQALQLAQQLVSLKPPTYWSLKAQTLIQQWSSQNSTIIQNPKIAYAVAIGFWRKQKYQQAILAFLRVINNLRNDQDLQKYGYDAWIKLGQSFWSLKLFYEAATCYRICSQRYPQASIPRGTRRQLIADQCAYWAYKAFLKAGGDPSVRAQAIAAREYLRKNWPDSPYSLNLDYIVANEQEDQAIKQARQVGTALPDLATCQKILRLFTQARQTYQRVQEGADMYELAQVKQGICLYKAAKFLLKQIKKCQQPQHQALKTQLSKLLQDNITQARQKLTAYCELARKTRIYDSDRIVRRQEALAYAAYYLGLLAYKQGTFTKQTQFYQQAIEYFNKLRQEHAKQRGLIQKANYNLIDAYIQTGQLAKAQALLKQASDRHFICIAANWLGNAYAAQAERLAKQKQEQLPALTKAADYFYQWLDLKFKMGIRVDPQRIDNVATRLVNLGTLLLAKQPAQARQYFSKAKRFFAYLAKKAKAEQRSESELKLGECLIQLGEWEAALEIFYPLYQQDRQARTGDPYKRIGEFQENLVYLSKLAHVLSGLAEKKVDGKNRLQNPERTFYHLMKWSRTDLLWEINDYYPRSTPADLQQKLLYFWQWSYWMIHGQQPIDDDIRAKEKAIRQSLAFAKTKRERAKVLKQLYIKEINDFYPPHPEKIQRYRALGRDDKAFRALGMAILRGYHHAGRLVAYLPKYQNPQRAFGSYDNPQWWAAKYRQIYMLYKMGQGERAIRIVKTLRTLYKVLGGPLLEKRFAQLLIEARTPWKRKAG